MSWRSLAPCAILTIFVGLNSVVLGGTAYDESVNGDFSNSGLAPTAVGPLTVGSNQVFGTTGLHNGALDRDYFTITVPTGFTLDTITVLPGTVSGGAISFIGLEAGPQITLPTNAASAAGLLGWWHYSPSDINSDILPSMAIPSNGSSGFTAPLAAGQYSFWVQDFNSGTFSYGFDFGVAAVSPVPEPGTLTTLAIGLAAVVPVLRRIRLRA